MASLRQRASLLHILEWCTRVATDDMLDQVQVLARLKIPAGYADANAREQARKVEEQKWEASGITHFALTEEEKPKATDAHAPPALQSVETQSPARTGTRKRPREDDGTVAGGEMKQLSAAPAPEPAPVFVVRPARAGDEEGAYRVCLLTGNAGQDASALYSDRTALGNRWVGPYLRLQPQLAFVLQDPQGVCGYTLGCLDTKAFYQRYCTEWLPALRTRWPDPCVARSRAHTYAVTPDGHSDPRSTDGKDVVNGTEATTPARPPSLSELTRDEEIYEEFHHPRLFFPALFEAHYPSHLHIDIIARAQGRSLGTHLIATLLSELKRQGSKGVHLEMHSENQRAYGFYTQKFGFRVIARRSFDCRLEYVYDSVDTAASPDLPAAHNLYLGLQFP